MTLQQFIIAEWAEELSAKLGRSKEELLNRGLSAGDFRLNEELDITLHDGSTAHFRYAFFIASKARRSIAVFTEHCGYHMFPYFGTKIQRISCDIFIAE
jgi:hypothetical protein